jgi:hypothetical protein
MERGSLTLIGEEVAKAHLLGFLFRSYRCTVSVALAACAGRGRDGVGILVARREKYEPILARAVNARFGAMRVGWVRK